MSRTAWTSLDPRTREHLSTMEFGQSLERGMVMYRCGCEVRDGMARLCQFHEGMDYGLEIARNGRMP